MLEWTYRRHELDAVAGGPNEALSLAPTVATLEHDTLVLQDFFRSCQ